MSRRNSKGGKGHRKASKGNNSLVRTLIVKDAEQEYARVGKALGDCQFECLMGAGADQTTVRGKVRGKMRKRAWVRTGSLVLCAKRDFDDKNVDIIHVYREEEVHRLKKGGHTWKEEGDEDGVYCHEDDDVDAAPGQVQVHAHAQAQEGSDEELDIDGI